LPFGSTAAETGVDGIGCTALQRPVMADGAGGGSASKVHRKADVVRQVPCLTRAPRVALGDSRQSPPVSVTS
jgi:hypothetical protein